MSLDATRDALSRIFYQRCFWLFAVLIVLIARLASVHPPRESYIDNKEA